jgi:hypothetical protein
MLRTIFQLGFGLPMIGTGGLLCPVLFIEQSRFRVAHVSTCAPGNVGKQVLVLPASNRPGHWPVQFTNY